MVLFKENRKKYFVKDKFSSVSPKYDLLNSILSCYVDHYWRRIAARELTGFASGPILDLCAGTLPLSLELIRQHGCQVAAVDFCYDMLQFGASRTKGREGINIICGDGEELPLPGKTFHGITVAFGVRNLGNLEKGLKEMFRVLKYGGKLVILEFSRPDNPLFRPIYKFYLHNILPFTAGIISGDKEAYRYLAESIDAFPAPKTVAKLMEKVGFRQVRYWPLTMGIVTIYTGRRTGDLRAGGMSEDG